MQPYSCQTNFPASNTLAECKPTVTASERIAVSGIVCGYDATPTGGLLTIVQRNAADDADAATLFSCPVTTAGPAPITLPRALGGVAGAKIAVRLSAGGSGVTGYLNVWMDQLPK